MVNRPKAIGTSAETAVVRALQRNGFPHAERAALRGRLDVGDITGTVGVCWEVKAGKAAETASDHQIAQWLADVDREATNARADVGVLVVKRRGIGHDNAERWWAVLRIHDLACGLFPMPVASIPVRLTLTDACTVLRASGYGEELERDA